MLQCGPQCKLLQGKGVCEEGNSFKAVLWWAWKAAKPVSLCSQHGSPRQPGVLQCPIISSLVSFSSHPLYRPLDSVYYHVPGSLSSLLVRAGMDFCLPLIWKRRATCLQKWRMSEERRSSAWTGKNEMSLWFYQVGDTFCMVINNTCFINCCCKQLKKVSAFKDISTNISW